VTLYLHPPPSFTALFLIKLGGNITYMKLIWGRSCIFQIISSCYSDLIFVLYSTQLMKIKMNLDVGKVMDLLYATSSEREKNYTVTQDG
jgi:hypothetical protein